jgi:hypothetical protein
MICSKAIEIQKYLKSSPYTNCRSRHSSKNAKKVCVLHDSLSGNRVALASRGIPHHDVGMFVVSDADATAIHAVFDEDGELSAAIELRRRFPKVTDNARAIAGWTPLPAAPSRVTRLRPRKDA